MRPRLMSDTRTGGTMIPSKNNGAGLVLGVWLVMAALGGAACSGSEAHQEAHAEYPVTHPLRTDTELTREYVAQVHAIQHIELRALERGYLEDIFVDEGQAVKEGTRMFRIMPGLYQAELKRAAAEAEFAGIEYENTKSLQDGNVVSPNELALAKAKLDKANAELSLARVHLGLTEVKAPFDGMMGRLHVRKGSLLEEGELLTTMADNSQMWVYYNVSEAEYLDYRERLADRGEPLPVQLRMANGKMFAHAGEVETIEADFNNETGNIAFRATFPNPDALLRHGETGKVVMTTPLKDVVVLPQKATFDVLDKKFVFVVGDEGVAKLREIRVAEELPHLFVVESGVSEEDRVLLDGLRKVRDGDHVAFRFEEPEGVIANLSKVHAE